MIVKRVFGTKHYWFPLPDDDVYLYPEFGQNPGWIFRVGRPVKD